MCKLNFYIKSLIATREMSAKLPVKLMIFRFSYSFLSGRRANLSIIVAVQISM